MAKHAHDPVSNPARQKAAKVPRVAVDAPEIWDSKPAKASGIPGVYSYPSGQGPTGPAPMFKT